VNAGAFFPSSIATSMFLLSKQWGERNPVDSGNARSKRIIAWLRETGETQGYSDPADPSVII